jgi:hypothetical protein
LFSCLHISNCLRVFISTCFRIFTKEIRLKGYPRFDPHSLGGSGAKSFPRSRHARAGNAERGRGQGREGLRAGPDFRVKSGIDLDRAEPVLRFFHDDFDLSPLEPFLGP